MQLTLPLSFLIRFARWRFLVLACTLLMPTAWAGQNVVRGRTANPHGPLRIACENCHTTTGWRPLRPVVEFNHDAQTRFPLRGMHQSVSCRSCHASLVFSKAGTRCADCHADLHRRQMGTNCESCHTVRGWNVAVQAVSQHTNRFPLIGAHAVAECESCHRGAAAGAFTGLSTQCASCHLKDYQSAASLDHQASHLPTTCDTCHTMDHWQGAKFDHAAFTKFPLTGPHAALECRACHTSGRVQGTASECYGGHASACNSRSGTAWVSEVCP